MNIEVIIPVHEFNEEVEKYLTRALSSVDEQDGVDEKIKVNIVKPKNLSFSDSMEEKMKEFKSIDIAFINNEGKTDFQSQVNLGAENVDSEFFSILEFDDELSITYFKQAVRHTEKITYADVFLPIIVEVNNEDKVVKLTNETVWSKQFVGEVGEMGFLNAAALDQYTDFKISGGIFRKSRYQNVGGLKSNIKLTFTYEFLLRLLNHGTNIYTIPKIGVKHIITREGSLFDVYGKTMSFGERKFWFETAKKESNFSNDREIDMSALQPASAESLPEETV